MNVDALRHRVKRMRRRGDNPMPTPEEPPQYVKGRSTLYDEEGNVRLQWVKEQADEDERKAALQAALQGYKDELPREPPQPAPQATNAKLLSCYIVTDAHIGMLAWGEETGEDWDTQIGEDTLVRWFQAAVSQAPDSERAVFAQLGDLLHHDGLKSITPESGNILDADTRFQHIVRAAIRFVRRAVHLLLQKHSHVVLIMADANHDPASEVWLREWCAAIYEDEPRITVDTNPDSYYCVEHGATSVFSHHGHLRKVADVDSTFAAKFRKVFGRTKYSYAHMGHLHHHHEKETNLMTVTQHRTLAARDAYASRHGYMAGREAKVITYHADYGEVGSLSITPEMVQGG
jgi:hypothetical protein